MNEYEVYLIEDDNYFIVARYFLTTSSREAAIVEALIKAREEDVSDTWDRIDVSG